MLTDLIYYAKSRSIKGENSCSIFEFWCDGEWDFAFFRGFRINMSQHATRTI